MEKFINVQPVILAAGKGTRMGQASIPKVLTGLAGKPLISYLLQELKNLPLGLKPIIVVGFRYDLVQGSLGKNYIYAFQEGQLGTAHALTAAKKHANGRQILVLYGDMPFTKAESIKRIVSSHHEKSALFSMFTTTVPNFQNEYEVFNGYGRIIRKNGKLANIIEFSDATERERQIKEVNPGVYLFNADWLWPRLEKINRKNKQNEYYLTDIIGVAASEGVVINDVPVKPMEVFGVNTKAQLEQAERLLG